MKPITVLLVDDHSIVREGMRIFLGLSDDFEVIGEASTGHEAVAIARDKHPDIVVMDIAMPELNGFEATKQIILVSPESRVLVLSAHSDDEYVSHMAAAGASGYLLKQNSAQALAHAIREIVSGRQYFSPAIAKRLRNAERQAREQGASPAKPKHPLTPREAEVLQLVAEGSANKQIAAHLGISIKTVEKHRQNLMNKLNIHNTADITRHAIATGVIESSIQTTID